MATKVLLTAVLMLMMFDLIPWLNFSDDLNFS